MEKIKQFGQKLTLSGILIAVLTGSSAFSLNGYMDLRDRVLETEINQKYTIEHYGEIGLKLATIEKKLNRLMIKLGLDFE